MTTRLVKPVRREVQGRDPNGRPRMVPLIVTLDEAGVSVRIKGSRTTFGPLSYGSLVDYCIIAGANLHQRNGRRRVRRGLLAARG